MTPRAKEIGRFPQKVASNESALCALAQQPVIVDDRVFVGSADGRIYGLDLKTGEKVWSYDAGAAFSASPAVAQGRLVIGNEEGVLYCFGNKQTE